MCKYICQNSNYTPIKSMKIKKNETNRGGCAHQDSNVVHIISDPGFYYFLPSQHLLLDYFITSSYFSKS